MRLSTTITGALLAWRMAIRCEAGHAVASALVVATSLAGTFALNDIIDCSCDALNTPWRPIPRGIISLPAARLVVATLFAVALATGALTGSGAQITVLLPITALCITYSTAWKRIPFVKNLGVSILIGAIAIYPALGSTRDLKVPMLLASVIAAFMLQKEIVADVRDISGDVAAGRRTLAASFQWLAILTVIAANAAVLLATLAPVESFGALPWTSAGGRTIAVSSALWSITAVTTRQRSVARNYLYFANIVALAAIVAL